MCRTQSFMLLSQACGHNIRPVALEGGTCLHAQHTTHSPSPFHNRCTCASWPGRSAGKFQWLQEFVGGFEGDVSLALRPNFAFALALAALRLEQQGEVRAC